MDFWWLLEVEISNKKSDLMGHSYKLHKKCVTRVLHVVFIWLETAIFLSNV